MNRRFIMALAASSLFGLVAILVFQQILKNRLDTVSHLGQTQIVYAASKIPAGTTIAPHQLKLVYQEAQSIPEGSFANMQDAVGRVPVVDVEPNLPVTTKNTTSSDKAGTLTSLKPGMRAVSIRVDEASSVSGFARPGSYVDVGAVLSPSSNSKPISKVLVQNLRVLAYGRETQAKTEGQRSSGTVTLEVTPAQASMLALAGREGPLYLILRHPADKDDLGPTPTVLMSGMVDDYKAEPPRATTAPPPTPPIYTPVFQTPTPKLDPTPTPSPASRVAVRVIAGDKSSEVTVRQ